MDPSKDGSQFFLVAHSRMHLFAEILLESLKAEESCLDFCKFVLFVWQDIFSVVVWKLHSKSL